MLHFISVQSRGRSPSQSRFLTTRPKVDFKRPTFFDFLTFFSFKITLYFTLFSHKNVNFFWSISHKNFVKPFYRLFLLIFTVSVIGSQHCIIITYVFREKRHVIFASEIIWVSFSVTSWKLRKFTSTEKIFRQNTYLVISLAKLLLSRNFCQNCAGVNSRNFHTVSAVYTSVEMKVLLSLFHEKIVSTLT